MRKLLLIMAMAATLMIGVDGMAIAFPGLPEDLNIVQPDPALPKELAAFSGKWQGKSGQNREFYFVIKEINEKKAILYFSFQVAPKSAII